MYCVPLYPRQTSIMLPSAIAFGDNVRVRSIPETERLGLAGRTGSVFGETTPSTSGVAVIGNHARDFALNIYFDELQEGFWFAEEAVEFIDHNPGATITLDGVAKRWVRSASGEWDEFSVE